MEDTSLLLPVGKVRYITFGEEVWSDYVPRNLHVPTLLVVTSRFYLTSYLTIVMCTYRMYVRLTESESEVGLG